MTWTTRWRKYENTFLISAEQVVQREENHRNREKGMGGLGSVWHNKFLFNNKSSYTKLPLEIVVLIRRKIRDGLKSKEGKMSQETPNTVVPVPMLVNRYTEKGQSHKLNTKSQYRRKLLQHLNGEKKGGSALRTRSQSVPSHRSDRNRREEKDHEALDPLPAFCLPFGLPLPVPLGRPF